MPGELALVEERLQQLPRGLRVHTQRVRQIAKELAQTHGANLRLVDIAAAAHDIARATKGEPLLQEAQHYGLPIHLVEKRLPILLHGPVAAQWLAENGVQQKETLEAVRWHSTFNKGLNTIAKIIFLADKLDPEKVRRYPYLEEIRHLAQDSLDLALLRFLDWELASLIQRGQLIHPASIEARNELVLRLGASNRKRRKVRI